MFPSLRGRFGAALTWVGSRLNQGPEDHTNMRILQTMSSGDSPVCTLRCPVPEIHEHSPVLGHRARLKDSHADVVFGASNRSCHVSSSTAKTVKAKSVQKSLVKDHILNHN